MARSKTTARKSPSGTTATATTVAPAPPRRVASDDFAFGGVTYRWSEGEGVLTNANALRDAVRREEVQALFARSIVPRLERFGARGQVFPAAMNAGMRPERLRWVAWQGEHDAEPVWGLYAAASALAAQTAPETLPANDAFVLLAWGDGPALAWADERPEAQSLLRAALREPPVWLLRGWRSRDVRFPVRVDRVKGGLPRAVPSVGTLPSREDEGTNKSSTAEAEDQRRSAVLALVRAWKRSNGREPLAV